MPIQLIAQNKKARYNYEILESFEAGIVLKGSEVKALRAKRANIGDSYCRFIKNELHLINAHITLLEQASLAFAPDPKAPRKLLLHKKQLTKLYSATQTEGVSIVPLKLYFNERNLAKVTIGLARGKKLHDKRETLKQKTLQKEALSALKNHFR